MGREHSRALLWMVLVLVYTVQSNLLPLVAYPGVENLARGWPFSLLGYTLLPSLHFDITFLTSAFDLGVQ